MFCLSLNNMSILAKESIGGAHNAADTQSQAVLPVRPTTLLLGLGVAKLGKPGGEAEPAAQRVPAAGGQGHHPTHWAGPGWAGSPAIQTASAVGQPGSGSGGDAATGKRGGFPTGKPRPPGLCGPRSGKTRWGNRPRLTVVVAARWNKWQAAPSLASEGGIGAGDHHRTQPHPW